MKLIMYKEDNAWKYYFSLSHWGMFKLSEEESNQCFEDAFVTYV